MIVYFRALVAPAGPRPKLTDAARAGVRQSDRLPSFAHILKAALRRATERRLLAAERRKRSASAAARAEQRKSDRASSGQYPLLFH